MTDWRQIVVQHPAVCSQCGTAMGSGALGWFDEQRSETVCLDCRPIEDEPMGPPVLSLGTPGRSALREYDRRRRRDAAIAKREFPFRVAGVVLAATFAYLGVQVLAKVVDSSSLSHHAVATAKAPFPTSLAHTLGVLFALAAGLVTAGNLWGRKQTTEAWAKGARGEQAVARRLAETLSKGVALLHDRRIPGSRANIDHIAIGPAGVFVLDAKNLTGRVQVRRIGSIWSQGPVRLFVGGHERSSLIEAMAAQVTAVKMVLADSPDARGVRIQSMLVLVGSEWGWLARAAKIRGVWVGWPKEASKVVSQRGPLSPETIRRIAATLATRLPPA